MLAAQAAQDFHGRLRSPRVAFTQAQYPDLIILVAGADRSDCIPQRYLLWGMARLMNHLVSRNDFRDSFVLGFQGSLVGNIYIGPPPQQAADTAPIALEPSIIDQANDTTATSISVDALSFHFNSTVAP